MSSQLIDLLTRIFSCGNMAAQEFQHMGVSVDNLIGCPWFQQDLPTGALDMRARCLEQTRARVASTDYEHVREYLLLAAQEYLASTAPGRAPSGGGWLPEVPAAKQQQVAGMAIADWMAGFAEEPEQVGEIAAGYVKSSGGRGSENGRNGGRNGGIGRAVVKGNGVLAGGDGGESAGMAIGAVGMDCVGTGVGDMGGDGDGE